MNSPAPSPAPAPLLGDMSSAAAISEISAWADLTSARRRALVGAVRAVQQLWKEAEPTGSAELRITCECLNRVLFRKDPEVLGYERRNFSNIVSRLRQVLRRLDRHAPDDVDMSPAWRALAETLTSVDPHRRVGLTRFLRFCAADRLEPKDVEQVVLQRFQTWCLEWTLCRDIGGLVADTVRNWNWATENVPGWPDNRLSCESRRDDYSLPLSAYPKSFQQDLEKFLDNLRTGGCDDIFRLAPFADADVSDGAHAKPKATRPCRPAKPRTIDTRNWQIRAIAGALVRSGCVKPMQLTSLRDLIYPLDRPQAALTYFRDRHLARSSQGPEADFRSASVADFAEVMRQIVKFHCDMQADYVQKLQIWRNTLKPKQTGTMTEKNQARLRRLLEPATRAKLLHLPAHWRQTAELDGHSPNGVALQMLYAVALEILLICPMRRKNLVELRLSELEFERRSGLPRLLSIGAGCVKNEQQIEWPIPDESAQLIRQYVRKYRGVLVERENPYLFPGYGLAHRNIDEFGTQLTKRVEREIGAEFNLHLVRHFAVCNFLIHHPGQYVIASMLLGHKSVETTRKFYAGLEAAAAARSFDETVLGDRRATKLMAASAFRGRTPQSAVTRRTAG